MKLRELIERLEDYNLDADVYVNVHCRHEDFSLAYGGPDGVTKADARDVSFYVDRLCTKESEIKPIKGIRA